jgi:hypothetical protein
MPIWINYALIALAVIAVVVVVAYVVGLVVHTVDSESASEKSFDTPDEAAADWKNTYQSKSKDIEYGAILYSEEVDGEIKYFFGRTYEGYSHNTIPGFFYGYTTGAIGNLFSYRKTVGFIHSHPQPPSGYVNDFFSPTDEKLVTWPGIDYMYLVPYSNSNYFSQPSDSRFQILW